jgi:alpha/beta superfamily hydrolase
MLEETVTDVTCVFQDNSETKHQSLQMKISMAEKSMNVKINCKNHADHFFISKELIIYYRFVPLKQSQPSIQP